VRWEDDINDKVPRELPYYLVATNEKPKSKPTEKVEELKEIDIGREEIIQYAMTVTGVIDQEVISEALTKVFDKEPLSMKVIHKNAQKILDAVEIVEGEKSMALIEGLKEETKVPKEEFNYVPYVEESKVLEEEKVINYKSNSHVQYVLNENGDMIKAPGRNKKCHCGSRRKYKDCCMIIDKERTMKSEHAEKEKIENKKPDTMKLLYI